jgi:type IV secretion/conjugal transfer VirB4 family ATPase
VYRNEYRTKPRGLADLLLPDALIEDGILLQQDGSLLTGWSFRGPDTMSASVAEMAVLSARLNQVLRLGSGWMLQCDAIRSQAPGYPRTTFPDPVTTLIDEERRQQFLKEGAHFESEYFLTLTYLPPLEVEERIKGWMFEGGQPFSHSRTASAALEEFKNKVDAFENVFGTLFRSERMKSEAFTDEYGCKHVHDPLLRYFRRCLTGEDHSFELPDIPVFLNDVLACQDFVGGLEPRIGRKQIAVIAIDGFPKASFPGILGALDAVPLEYRWNTRAHLIDPREASGLFDVLRKKWRSKVRGFKDTLFKTHGGAVNHQAQEMSAEAEAAMGMAESGQVQFCQYSSNIVCLEESREKLYEHTRQIIKTIQNLGFACRLETVNAVAAWLGTLPGDGYSNVRRVLLHTLNLADMLPISSVWAGLPENPSALLPGHSAPLLYAATSGATPFRLNLHVSDVGHTIIAGPTGAGKSTLLGLIAAQWFRYPRAQVFVFDQGRSIWMLTKAAGGEFYDLAGPKSELAFCPLRAIDNDAELAWAAGWIENLCELNGLKFGPPHRNRVAEALRRLRVSPARTLTEFYAEVQMVEIREALLHFTMKGPLGPLLDAGDDSLAIGDGVRMLAFETEHLLKLGDKAVIPVLQYLFHRIEQRLDGSPSLIVLDEAWKYLGHDVFSRTIEDWLRTMRKKNAAVVMATQQMGDVSSSKIAPVIIGQCPTKILLPNAEAKESGSKEHPGQREFYERLGMNERELDILECAIPKQHYYIMSPLGRRLVDLGLGRAALAFVGVNGAGERRVAERVMKQYPDSWRGEWLRLKGLGAWAEYLDRLESRVTEQHVKEERRAYA